MSRPTVRSLVGALLALVGAAVCAPLATAALAFASLADEAESFVLRDGGRVRGKVVKETAEDVFVDVGYTILEKLLGTEILPNWTMFVMFAIALAVASAMYHLVEQPCRRWIVRKFA